MTSQQAVDIRQEKDGLPASYSVVAPPVLLEEIRRAYRLLEPAACQLLRRGLHDTYLIATGERRLVARLYRARARSLADVGYEVDLLMHLARRGVSVSEPIADEAGRPVQVLALPEGDRPLVLFTYAAGQRVGWTAPEAHRAGALLATLHNEAGDFVSAHKRSSLDLETLIDRPMEAIEPYMRHRRADWEFLCDLAMVIRRQIEACSASLDWGPCHGDFGAKNIHSDGDGRLTAFDFDRCGEGWRAIDFALVMWAASGRRRPEMRDAFLEGYVSRRPLGAADLQVLPLFHALARLGSLGMLAGNADAWGRLCIQDESLEGALAFFRTWHDEQLSNRTLEPA